MPNKITIVYKGDVLTKKYATALQYACDKILNNVATIEVRKFSIDCDYDICLTNTGDNISLFFPYKNVKLDLKKDLHKYVLNNIILLIEKKKLEFNPEGEEDFKSILSDFNKINMDFFNKTDICVFEHISDVHDFFDNGHTNNVDKIKKIALIVFWFEKKDDYVKAKPLVKRLFLIVDLLLRLDDIEFESIYLYSPFYSVSLPPEMTIYGDKGGHVRYSETPQKTKEKVKEIALSKIKEFPDNKKDIKKTIPDNIKENFKEKEEFVDITEIKLDSFKIAPDFNPPPNNTNGNFFSSYHFILNTTLNSKSIFKELLNLKRSKKNVEKWEIKELLQKHGVSIEDEIIDMLYILINDIK